MKTNICCECSKEFEASVILTLCRECKEEKYDDWLDKSNFRKILNIDNSKTYRSLSSGQKRLFRIAKRDGAIMCFYCESKENLSADHLIPKSFLKKNSIKNHGENYIVSCRKCQRKKNSKFPSEIEDLELKNKVWMHLIKNVDSHWINVCITLHKRFSSR